ncbi:MAG: precorrin-3B C(17)-methyltransferase [Actinomycetota bacterium]
MTDTIVSVSITDAGRRIAHQLPFEHSHGDLGETVRARWNDVDGLVLVAATGIAVRVIAPLLTDKDDGPFVVAVDDTGRFAVPLCGGHRGANDTAEQIASLIQAEAVITTATDRHAVVALDTLPGVTTHGDVAAVTRAILDGEPVEIDNPLGWPLPDALPESTPGAPCRITVTDLARDPAPGEVVLHPPSLVLGVGAASNAASDAASALVADAMAEHGLAEASVAMVATIDRREADPVITSLGHPIVSFRNTDLSDVAVPNPSEVVRAEVGTASVAEAAALLAAGPGAELVSEKRKGPEATLAIARRRRPLGEVRVVGLGPGHARHRTAEAVTAIRSADVAIGYRLYVDQCEDLLSPRQRIIRSPIGAEVDRCTEAVQLASEGATVALVCSGDSGVFAMATLALEVAPRLGNPPIHVVAGVTASLAAASILGAPLAHDHALISLSDLMTPWPLIERRVQAIAEADMAVAFYNPRSQRRTEQLVRAHEILLQHRPDTTPVGVVVNATRPTESVMITTLADFDPASVDMFSIVIVGSSTTEMLNGRMVTPRGYES